MVKRNAHCCGRVILLELAHCEIRVGHIPRRIHCVSPDRLLLRFFCQRVFSESPRTALRENLIALVNTSRDDANGRALGSSPAEKGGRLSITKAHETLLVPKRQLSSVEPLGRCTVLRGNARSASRAQGRKRVLGRATAECVATRLHGARFDSKLTARGQFSRPPAQRGRGRRLSRPLPIRRAPSTCSWD